MSSYGHDKDAQNAVSILDHIDALMEEQRRAITTADSEREKAASALREGLAQQIQSGDAALRDHISNQIAQIKASLAAAERAMDKFETSVSERFATVNEFRGSLDDLGKQMATRRETESAIANVAEAVEKARQERQHQIDDLRTTLAELRSRLDVGAPQLPEIQQYIASQGGRQQGVSLSSGYFFAGLAALGTIIAIIIVIANALTGQ